MSEIIDRSVENELAVEQKTTGQKILGVLKFIFFTLIKMIFVVLTVASLFIAVFGVIAKIFSKAGENGLIKQNNGIMIALCGAIAAACFFLVKTFHSVLRPYFWPAVGALAVCIAVIVIVEPAFYVDALNYVRNAL